MDAGHEMAEIMGLDPMPPMSQVELIDRLDSGLPLAALANLANRVAPEDSAFPFKIVPRATLARRRKAHPANPLLSAEESAKVARVASVWAVARSVWGDDAAARAFLNRPHPLLGMQRPIDVTLRSEFGGPLVENVLNRLRYGSAA